MAMKHGGGVFAAAEQRGVPWQQVLDFSASINPLGPSPAAREAIVASLDRIVHYPDSTALRLRQRLAKEWQVTPRQILAGNGATDLLYDFCRVFPSGTIAVPAFNEFHRLWPSAKFCPLADPARWPGEGPLVLTRPANPTGELTAADTIVDFARRRQDVVLVDESFLDFSAAPSLAAATSDTPNLLVLRSLTKFFALPGLRVGALIASAATIERFAAVRPPWPVNAMAEAAALASLDDTAHAIATRALIATETAWLSAALAELPGCHAWPTQANYLYVETQRATALVAFAAARGVLIRDCSDWPGFARPSVRLAVRRRWENAVLLATCKEFLCATY